MPKPEFITSQLFVSIIVILIVVHVILVGVGGAIYLERKISAYSQDRIGPNRVGFDFGLPFLAFLKGMWGLGQFLADGLKFLLKEDYMPKGADKWLFSLAPMTAIIPALMGFAIIPWGGQLDIPAWTIPLIGWEIAAQRVTLAGAPVNVGIIYLLGIASLGVYGIVLGGWASNNKYSFLGGLRSSAQMISYEIPLGLSLLAALLLVGSLQPQNIISYQVENGWLLFAQPISAVIFFIAILAEANRAPFDNAECEQELVAGFHTEYSSMRFALYPLSEYAHMITSSAFFALVFMGGYHAVPFFNDGFSTPEATGIIGVIVKAHVFAGKVATLVCFMMLIRWTIPRLRFDQVMQVAWNAVIPLSLFMVVFTAVMVHLERTSLVEMLLGNLAIMALTLAVIPMLPQTTSNRKVRLAGSRFFPLEGELVSTGPTHPVAREDRPVEGVLRT
jgi:NADH-quinone oxidoreductase subunit H